MICERRQLFLHPEYQVGDCKNSLTPLAGESSSMPAGFYWDGVLFMVLGAIGLVSSLFAHLVIMSSWRSRAKAMKEVEDDTTDAHPNPKQMKICLSRKMKT